MKKIQTLIMAALVVMSFGAVTLSASAQSVQVFTANNSDGKITPASIEEAFKASGLMISGNNNMNNPFELRFKKTHYKTYNLAVFQNDELALKLIKKYPSFGVLAPLTMSIWSDDTKKSMNISTLTLEGLARTANIPLNDPDLVAYSKMIKKALKNAMPKGNFKKLNFTVKEPKNSFAINFEMEMEIGPDDDINDLREEFESEFEGEMEPIGFLFPNYFNLQEDLFEPAGYDAYDFYVTYSICKFDVIFPVSKLHPEAGAYAPCTFFMYKKKGENTMHMGFLGVKNWITTLDIEDQESIKPLLEAQGMIEDIVNEMIE